MLHSKRLVAATLERSDRIALALLVLNYVASQPISWNDASRELWLALLIRLIREVIEP